MNNKSLSRMGSPPTQELHKGNSMNKAKRLIGMIGIVLGGALPGYTTYGQPSVSVAVSVPLPTVEIRVESDFYEPLTPHGEWVVVGSYGRCWRPGRVVAGWRPYCNGNWQRTDAGWYWASDEPWAWATYHYGRWDFTDQYGWYWVPQTQWAPAWVSWHEGGGYVGWAPLQPSVSISVGGYVGFSQSRIAPRAYVFVEQRRFLDPIRPATVVVNNTTIINKTTVITNTKIVNNTVINEGPATAVIEKASGRKVQAVPVRELRRKQEAAVASKQPTPAAASEKKVQAPVRSEAQPREKKAVPAPTPPQVQRPAAATPESAAPAARNHEAPGEKHKPAPAVAEFQPEGRPEGNHPSGNKPPAEPKANKHAEKQEKPAQRSDKNVQPPGRENPAANESNGASPAAEKEHGNKPKE
jgi:hypothetical protein